MCPPSLSTVTRRSSFSIAAAWRPRNLVRSMVHLIILDGRGGAGLLACPLDTTLNLVFRNALALWPARAPALPLDRCPNSPGGRGFRPCPHSPKGHER